MNRQNVLNFANTVFDKIDQIDEDVYKAQLTFGTTSTAGIYYLDFSKKISEGDFKEYQQSLLGKEYFKNRGSLQWNYYLLILQDTLEKEKKHEIESDDQFARKYVFNEDEFRDFFTIEKSLGAIDQDVTIKWKKKLDDIDFSEVYSRIPMNKAVERYVSNESVKVENPDFFEGKEKLKIDSIDRVTLTSDFREYPKEHRDLSFGKANLFFGSNGVGKTSLFESIEMMLCGKTFQNPNNLEEESAIKAFFNGSGKEFKYKPNDNELYRSRDLFWYSNPKSRKNNLVESFNRFNYFNSDAAYEFSKGDNEESIRNALYNLVLGPEYIYLKERVGKIWTSYIRPDFNRLKKDLNDKQKDYESAENELNKITVNGKMKIFEDAIIKNSTKLKLVDDIKDLENNYPSLELKISKVEVILDSIQKLYSDEFTLNKLHQLIEQNETYKALLESYIDKVKRVNEKVRAAKRENEAALIKIKTLDSARKYFEHPELFNIEGFQKRKSKIERLLTQIDKVYSKAEGANFDSIVHQDYSFDKVIKEILRRQRDAKKDQELTNEQIESFLKRFGDIERLNKQILQLGKDMFELRQDMENCPMCLTYFEPKELEMRIHRIIKTEDEKQSDRLSKLNAKQKEIQRTLETLSQQYQVANLLRECLSTMDVDDDIINKNTVTENIKLLRKELNKKEDLTKEKIYLENFEDKIMDVDASESELQYIRNEFETHFPDVVFSAEGSKDFYTAIDTISKKRSELSDTVDKLLKLSGSEDEKFKANAKLGQEVELDIKLLKNNQEKSKDQMKNALSLFDDLARELTVDKLISIAQYQRSLSLIGKNIGLYKDELKNRSQLKFWKKQKQKSSDYINKNKNKLERLQRANKLLESMENEMASNAHLESFFDDNLKEIFDVFMTIHVPKEFKSIKFDNGYLYLIDESGQKRKVTEISTGQRSALALSIFLCLNRKLQNGPNIILFDDPVSFIDDFNALSFLDFLRYFVLHENKQLFFATANVKLASLFKKKFFFLQEEFKNWEFKRELQY